MSTPATFQGAVWGAAPAMGTVQWQQQQMFQQPAVPAAPQGFYTMVASGQPGNWAGGAQNVSGGFQGQ